MTSKIHLRANKVTPDNGATPYSFCASVMDGNRKVRPNARATYRFMASEIVRGAEFAAAPASDRCVHCVDILRQRRAMYPNVFSAVCGGQ